MLCKELDKKCEKDFLSVGGKKGWSGKTFKKGEKKKMRTEKLNRIAKKLRSVSKVQTLEQEYAALEVLGLLARKTSKHTILLVTVLRSTMGYRSASPASGHISQNLLRDPAATLNLAGEDFK